MTSGLVPISNVAESLGSSWLCTANVPVIEGAVQLAVRLIDWPGAMVLRAMKSGVTPELEVQIVLPLDVTENPSMLGPIGTETVSLVLFVTVNVIATV
jgi:hypothetical protein